MGPQSYEVMPDIKRRNHNTSTFDKSRRRFKFNQNVEAIDPVNSSSSGGGGARQADANKMRSSLGVFERRKV